MNTRKYNEQTKTLNLKPRSSPAVLVIVGSTASGKSALALQLAEQVGGEIICADSRTVYKGMDIGTAKPTAQERAAVPHHLLDVVEPDEPFTAADFKRLAQAAIHEIHGRNRLPIIVGGSGLYIDALLFDYGFSSALAARDPLNPRHLNKSEPRQQRPLRPHTLVIGLDVPREQLKTRIEKRVEVMLEAGFIDEIKGLVADYPDSKALLAPGYKAFTEYLTGRLSLDEAKALFARNDYQLAKRQMTWFRRNKSIHWLGEPSTYLEDCLKLLNKLQ